ncbi:restriction endonuclease subunit S [Prevotella jejuni]
MREDWEYKKLEDISSAVLIEKAKKRFSPNDVIRYIDISSIDNINQCLTGTTSFKMLDAPSRAQQKVEYGDILISTVRPNLRNIAIVNDDATNLVASSGFCVLRINDAALRRYVFYYVVSNKFTAYLEKLTNGANYPAVKETDVRKALIPIPPKPTQLSIVTELDKLNELIQIKKEQLKDYDTLAQSIFYEMFGDPVVNDKKWEVKQLKDVSTLLNGRAYKQQELLDKGKYKVLRVGNFFTNSTFYYSDLELDDDKYCEYGDLLFAWSASFGAFIWNGDKVIYHYHIWKVLFDKECLDIHYYRYLLNTMTSFFMNDIHGIGMVHLTKFGMEQYVLPIPPLPLQQSFAHKIEQIDRQKAAVQRTIKDLETLLAARMQYWFE